MGATQGTANHNSIALKTENKQIILHYSYKTMLKISQATTFPHGYQGLKTWDANVVMARFILINLNKFKDKSIIEMCSGTGLVGVTLGKYTSLKKLTITDLTDEVIGLIKNNCQKNELDESKFIAFRLMWDQYVKFVAKYDIICVSDPFFHRCTPQLLTAVANHYLQPGGVLYLSSPKSESLQKFLKIASQTKFEVHKQKLNSYEYLSSPLLNQVDGQKQFPSVCAGDIDIYQIVKKPPTKGHHDEQDVNLIHRKQLERIRQQKYQVLSTPKKEKQLEQIDEGIEEDVADGQKEKNQQEVNKEEEHKEINQKQEKSQQKEQTQMKDKVDDKLNVNVQKHGEPQEAINASQGYQSQETQKNEIKNDEQKKQQEIIRETEQKVVVCEENKQNNDNNDASANKQHVEVEPSLDKNEIVQQQVASQSKQIQKEKEELQSQTQAKSQIDAVLGKAQTQVEIEVEKLNEQICVNHDKQEDIPKIESLNEQTNEPSSQANNDLTAEIKQQQNEAKEQPKQQEEEQKESAVKKKKKKNKKK